MAYERDEKGALVPFKEKMPDEAIRAFEAADEEAIVQSLTQVEAQPFFAYSYPIKTKEGTKDIIGVSVDGAKEIARELGNIRAETDVKVQEKDDYFYGIVPVTDLTRNVTLLGFARQSKYVIGEGMVPGDRIDETSYVKALSKAQRNGILSIAPQRMIAEIVGKLDTRMIKRLSGPPTRAGLLAPKAAKPRQTIEPGESVEEKEIKSLRQQLHLKWEELHKLDPSVSDKKDWLKDHYKVESSIELSLEQIKEAVQNISAMITMKAGPQSTADERKTLAKEIMDFLKSQGQSQAEASKKAQEMFTEGKGGRTQQDLESIRTKFAELKQPKASNADAEADAFLKELGD